MSACLLGGGICILIQCQNKENVSLVIYVFLYLCLLEAVEGGNGRVAYLGESMFCFLECSILLLCLSSEDNGVWWAGWQAVGKQLGSTLEYHC